MIESNRIEYKRELTDSLEKEPIGLLNCHTIEHLESPRQDLRFEQLTINYETKGMKLNKGFMKNLELLTDEGAYNYAAYLLADQNGNSVQVAKYAGTDRVDLLDSKEYGYC